MLNPQPLSLQATARPTMRRVVLAVMLAMLTLGSLLSQPAPKAQAATNNNEIGYRYFVAKGLPAFQSAGIMGNLMQESGNPIDPRATQYPSGPGRGIAQWSVGERWATLTNWASAQGRDPWALSTQLDFIWHEFSTTEASAYRNLRATSNLYDATIVFSHQFERCGTCHDATRYSYAQQIMNTYGGGGGGTSPGSETALPTLQQGASGQSVFTLQRLLGAAGQPVTVDGAFGSGTDAAVRRFQSSRSLAADGIVGTNTWQALLPILREGSSGLAVTALQSELQQAGYSLSRDGSFGPATTQAVIAYQRANGLDADGIVGPATWGSLID